MPIGWIAAGQVIPVWQSHARENPAANKAEARCRGLGRTVLSHLMTIIRGGLGLSPSPVIRLLQLRPNT
jgi:hypothetical protein